jgi:hypothetical protein
MVPRLLAFSHLRERNIVKSWQQVKNLIRKEGFPPGRMLGPNSRRWTEDEIGSWLDSRPVPGASESLKPLRSGAKQVKEGTLNPRRKAAEAAASQQIDADDSRPSR